MCVSIKKPRINKPKLKHTYKPMPIKALCRSFIAHKKISLPGRGKDKSKYLV